MVVDTIELGVCLLATIPNLDPEYAVPEIDY
jgi:hypothetical protein